MRGARPTGKTLATNDQPEQGDADLPRSALLVLAAIGATLASCDPPIAPPLPPLLQDARSTGGTNNLCEGATPGTAARSPEIVARLRRAFPPGTPAARLRRSLVALGFELHPACSPDRRVSWAAFRQHGGGFNHYPAFATVYWREDDRDRVVWTTGDIAFTGP